MSSLEVALGAAGRCSGMPRRSGCQAVVVAVAVPELGGLQGTQEPQVISGTVGAGVASNADATS